MSLYDDRICTCDQREHACSPPCEVHPEKGGGLGNPGERPLLTGRCIGCRTPGPGVCGGCGSYIDDNWDGGTG